MLKIKRIVFLVLIMMMSLTFLACGENGDPNVDNDDNNSNITEPNDEIEDELAQFKKTVTNQKTANFDDTVVAGFYSTIVKITLDGSTYQKNYNGNNIGFYDDGSGNIIIYSKIEKVAFEISGELKGSLSFYTEKKVMITLNGVTIESTDRPAFNIISNTRAFIVLKGENTLKDSEAYGNNVKNEIYDAITNFGIELTSSLDLKGAFFSEAQVIFSGNGILNIEGNAKTALSVDSYIRFFGGIFNLTSKTDLAIHANDYIIVDSGTININESYGGVEMKAGCFVMNGGRIKIDSEFTNGILANNIEKSGKLTLNNGNESYNYGDIEINNGIIDIINSVEGLETKNNFVLNNGYLTIVSSNDGISSDGQIVINDGFYYSNSLDDSIDANYLTDAIIINGGVIVATGKVESIEATFGKTVINGGTVLGFSDFVKRPSTDGLQNIVITSGFEKDERVSIQNAGTSILSFVVPKACQTLLFSCASLEDGKTYDIVSGGTIEGDESFFGLYFNAKYLDGNIVESFTVNNKLLLLGGSTY